MNKGVFIVSLDFEIHWGVRDSRPIESYRQQLLGVRKAIPGMLELFEQYGIHATWATVGFLFARDKKRLLSVLPASQPSYTHARFSPYPELEQLVGADEDEDPYHYGASLIRQIRQTPFQEIGTHTFSHYYCLEPGQNIAQFDADLAAACRIAEDEGYALRSIVFPRNQYEADYLEICRRHGIIAYRGNESSWLYAPKSRAEESKLRRALRLADAYLNLSGHHTPARPRPDASGMVNVPASRFLRPFSKTLRALDPLRLQRMLNSLDEAAKRGRMYHIWWHPHNFGANTAENLAFLRKILERYRYHAEAGRMESLNMGEVAEQSLQRYG